MNTTKKVCVGLGQTDEEGKKFAKFDEVVAKVQAAAATPDSQGSYADYIELMKLYDKNSNGTMMLAELDNILANLGDEVPKDEVQKLFAEIPDPEDEDGFFPSPLSWTDSAARPKNEDTVDIPRTRRHSKQHSCCTQERNNKLYKYISRQLEHRSSNVLR